MLFAACDVAVDYTPYTPNAILVNKKESEATTIYFLFFLHYV